jgi:DNA invertase Pin-like site-specific DNA recombinase
MVYGYLRQLFGKRDIANQQSSIISFALSQELHIDKEVIEYSNQNRPLEEREQFEKFVHGLKSGDIILVDELWMLSERVDEIIKIIYCMLGREIVLYSASSQTLITSSSTIGEIFPLLNSLRQKQKIRQNQKGRPRGSKSKSKFDPYQLEIIDCLKDGMSVSAIARRLMISRSSLKDYIRSRGIKEMIEGSWVGILPSSKSELDNKIVICPFDKQHKTKQ